MKGLKTKGWGKQGPRRCGRSDLETSHQVAQGSLGTTVRLPFPLEDELNPESGKAC